jgi:hypothetical protein
LEVLVWEGFFAVLKIATSPVKQINCHEQLHFSSEKEIMIMKDRTQHKKSLGALRKAKKAKQRYPDLIGQLHLPRHTLLEIARQAKESNDNGVMCNLAAWRNEDKNGSTYLSVELSPWYMSRTQRKAKSDVFGELLGDGED